jgi:phage virion morphogenesis protein
MVDAGVSYSYSFVPSPMILAAELEDMAMGISSMKEPLTTAVRKVMIPSIQENFQMGGRPTWEPLSDATEQIKFAGGYDTSILVRSGALKQQMGYVSTWQITDTEAYIDSLPDRIYYGGVHQAGSRSGGGRGSNIPAREFAIIQDQDEQAIQDIFDAWIVEKEVESGWG